MRVNQLDLRRLLIALVFLIIAGPWFAVRLVSTVIGTADRIFCRCWGILHRWANPDIYGNAPVRCRRLVYTRRTVEGLVQKIESLNRQVRRQDARAAGDSQVTAAPEPQQMQL